ncbi:double zinc ribbon domain-containing protein [Paracoccus pacificus]|uniref:Double zinc ribbon domain-containing protein n=1 Tax=Paracoccus pacificus TaxID=1463598 RepID=A0ABW4R9B0_9RHOB
MGFEHRLLPRGWKVALRLLYPPQCLGCGATVDHEGGLCGDCWRETRFIREDCCDLCGVGLPAPGDVDDPGGGVAADQRLLCDDCVILSRPWVRGRAALDYSGGGRRLVLALKHGDRPDLAPALGQWLASAAQPLARPGMIVAPIPIPARRLLRRKYNQSALLAATVARQLGLEHRPGLLQRLRHTPAQDHRDLHERFDNQADAIGVRGPAGDLAGRPVMIVDDVMASGATMTAAATALHAAGAGPIVTAVLARAAKND